MTAPETPDHDDKPRLGRLVPEGRPRWAAAGVGAVLAVASAVVLATASWSSVSPFGDDDLPDGAVFEVDGTVVTEAQLETRVESLEALYGVQPPTAEAELDEFRRDAARSLAVSMVIEAQAADRDIVVADKQAQAQLSTIISEQLGGDRSAFTSYLSQAGVTEREVLDEITRTLTNQRLYEAVTADVPAATDAEAQAEYDSRQSEMKEADQRRISNIVVETEAAAQQVKQRLDQGEAFAEVAREVSLDPSTKSKGGDLGALPLDRLDPAFGEAAFAAEKGATFGPVESQFGWNVGQVVDVLPGRALSFDEVKDTLLASLTTKAQLEVWRSYMRDALADADIVYADDYRPDDPDALPSDLVSEPVAGAGGSEDATP